MEEKLNGYHQLAEKIVRDYVRPIRIEDVDVYPVIDREGGHYQVVRSGWRNRRYIYGPVIHIDIKDGKFWIRHNGTELDLAAQLHEGGAPVEDIVLGFKPPYYRDHAALAMRT